MRPLPFKLMSLLVAVILVAPLPALAAIRPVQAVTLSAEVTVSVPLFDWLHGELDLQFASDPNQDITLGPVSASHVSWPGASCVFRPSLATGYTLTRTPPPGCGKVWSAFWAAPGDYALIHQGQTYRFKIAEPAKKLAYEQTIAGGAGQGSIVAYEHPPWVAPDTHYCHAGLQGIPVCDTTEGAPVGAKETLRQALELLRPELNESLAVLYELGEGQASQAVEVTYIVSVANAAPTVSDGGLEKQCTGETKLGGFKGYLVCVNALIEGNMTSKVIAIGITDALASSGHLWTNRPIRVIVGYPRGGRATAELSGDRGTLSSVYVQTPASVTGVGKAGQQPPQPPSEWKQFDFIPRKGGSNVELTVKLLKYAPEKKEYQEVDMLRREFDVERRYWAAIRTGISPLYGPSDETYEVETTTGNNAGNELVIKESGTTSIDVTVGVSFFVTPVGEFSLRPAFSWYVGLSLLSANATTVNALNALITGPELSFGKDFSLAGVVGLRRTTHLEKGVEVDSSVPTSKVEDYTVFGVTPVFGLMVNLSPLVFGGR
jgi:hypothetical protein